jgi:glycosyltransferase involved in cell wall biosynthesis
MRIVYYLPSLYITGGLERVITEKANYLADQFGYEVIILTSEQQDREICYRLSSRVRHHDLGLVFDNPKNKSLLLKVLSYPFKYFLFKKRFSAFLIDIKPDITISTLRREINFIHKIGDGSVKIGELHITRNAYSDLSSKIRSIHRIIPYLLDRRFANQLKRFDRIILLTKEEQEIWAKLHNTIVIHNFLASKSVIPAELDNKNVIAVGRYSHQKGFDLLVEAWSVVAKKHPDWILNVYGDGDRTELQNKIDELNLTKSFIANEKTDAIIQKYLESSIFVLSSRYEGFGLVLIEAMNCGVPPVSFACPTGPKDIITHGEDGILVENGNIEQLAEKICYLIENEDVRKKMGRNARENVKKFKKEIIMDQWKKLFEMLIHDKL